jgi:mannose-1-phosphate guanylyltransferase
MREAHTPAAMVLAAGLGTRLRPLTDVRAKPLVPVGDRPALAHVVDHLRAAGVRRIVVNAHHRAHDVRDFAASLADTVAVSEEHDLLGTAGGIAFARPLLGDGDLLLWNGDILAGVDVAALVSAHASEATLVVQPLAAGQGPVGLDAEGNVVRLRQERFAEEASGGQFLGISLLSASLRTHLPDRGGLIEDLFVPALRRGATLRAFLFQGPWHDIGSLPAYLAANLAWLEARSLPAWVGSGADVAEGVTLDRSVVGEGARILGSGPVSRCVLWPGTTAHAPLADAVVTGPAGASAGPTPSFRSPRG